MSTTMMMMMIKKYLAKVENCKKEDFLHVIDNVDDNDDEDKKKHLAKVEHCKNKDEQFTSKPKLLLWLLNPENGNHCESEF